jgi:hypothetical protein
LYKNRGFEILYHGAASQTLTLEFNGLAACYCITQPAGLHTCHDAWQMKVKKLEYIYTHIGTGLNHKNLNQNSRSPGQELNLGYPECEAGLLTTTLGIQFHKKMHNMGFCMSVFFKFRLRRRVIWMI